MEEPEGGAGRRGAVGLALGLREQRARGRARRASSSRICSVSSRWPFERSSQAFRARPSTPIVSACRVQRSGVAIERYWWMRANVIGCASVVGAARRRERQARLAGQRSARAAAEHRAHLRLVESGQPCRPERDQERGGLLAVRVVGGEQDLLRRDEAEEVEQVERAPDGGVEEDAGPAAEVVRERGQVGDAGVRDDQLRLVARRQARELVRDRRQAAAAVDQDRHVAVGGELEDRREPLVVEQELLRARDGA